MKKLLGNNLRGRIEILLSILLGVAGVLIIFYFLRVARVAELRLALARLSFWVPIVFALEGARIAVEALATRSLYGTAAHIPLGALLRTHILGYGLSFYMPAGRATAEAVKAAQLAGYATPARAAAVAAANQSLALLGIGIADAACACGAFAFPGAGRVAFPLMVFAAVSLALAVLIRAATLHLDVGWVRRFAPKTSLFLGSAQSEIRALFPLFPSAMFVVNRCLQLASIVLLFHAVGGALTLTSVLTAGGVNLLGASLGDMVPGQLGTTDAAFAVSAGLLGITVEGGIAIALAVHLVQLAWMGFGIALQLGAQVSRVE